MTNTVYLLKTINCLGLLSLLSFLFSFGKVNARDFKFRSGFDAQEADEIFILNFAFLDTVRTNTFPEFLDGYSIYYRSNIVGLDNTSDECLVNATKSSGGI